MRRLAVCLLLLAPALSSGRADDPEPPRPAAAELKRLQGTWDVVKALRDGKDDSKDLKDKGVHVVIDKDRFTFVERKGDKEAMTVTLAPKKKPAEMDLLIARDKERLEAIYKVEKDVLTVAFNDPGQGRPKSFDKAKGLIELKKRPAKK
jgi:uncharacterized protein (TIGR03067 family)